MAQTRKALETIEQISGLNWPGQKKDKKDRAVGQRWAWIRSVLVDQASGALHIDAGTEGHVYNRGEAETLIRLTAALLTVVP